MTCYAARYELYSTQILISESGSIPTRTPDKNRIAVTDIDVGEFDVVGVTLELLVSRETQCSKNSPDEFKVGSKGK